MASTYYEDVGLLALCLAAVHLEYDLCCNRHRQRHHNALLLGSVRMTNANVYHVNGIILSLEREGLIRPFHVEVTN